VFWPDTKISMDPNDPIDESPTWRKCRWDGAIYPKLQKKTEGTFVIMSAMPLKDKTGKITGVAVFHDITERKSENLIKT
jgi:hypothetical protein